MKSLAVSFFLLFSNTYFFILLTLLIDIRQFVSVVFAIEQKTSVSQNFYKKPPLLYQCVLCTRGDTITVFGFYRIPTIEHDFNQCGVFARSINFLKWLVVLVDHCPRPNSTTSSPAVADTGPLQHLIQGQSLEERLMIFDGPLFGRSI